MKHQVYALLLCMSFSLCADSDNHIVDKSKRIGRFSYEDSFDENLVDDVLKHLPAAAKKTINRLLYPSDDEDIPQRLLLLGGTSNASTTAVAKTIAQRCGYEYYVIDAAALLREYREGRQMLLSEVRPIIKQGKPLALIITELPEMTDYSGLLASTLWLLIDQAAQYPDVLVIATSAFEKGQLSEDVKERFGENIVSVVFDKKIQNQIEGLAISSSWIDKSKIAYLVGGAICCAFATGYIIKILLVLKILQDHQKNGNLSFERRVSHLDNGVNDIGEESKKQHESFQNQINNMQKQLTEMKNKR